MKSAFVTGVFGSLAIGFGVGLDFGTSIGLIVGGGLLMCMAGFAYFEAPPKGHERR